MAFLVQQLERMNASARKDSAGARAGGGQP
jgi:hypothetical protein